MLFNDYPFLLGFLPAAILLCRLADPHPHLRIWTLVLGAGLFGIGWGLVGLCPGPALESLATLSPGVIVFVAAMAGGMFVHDIWQASRPAIAREIQLASATDG